MTGRALYFTDPYTVDIRETSVPDPGPEEVRVRVERSGISPGTELRVYRGEFTPGTTADETIAALDEPFSYPLQYGYTAVGEVTAVGDDVAEEWLGRQVFAFQPHASHFVADPETLIPTELPPEQALFIPNTEAATNFVMDARPRIGARVVVFGQGPVGLLTTKLLAEFPLAELVTVDRYENRRRLSESFGADRSVAPGEAAEALRADADIAFELSGNPDALDSAIDVTGFAGQVIVGSWYGSEEVTLTLDEAYHRSHVRVRSSQVSRIDPDHTDRWDKDRRMDVVRSWLADADLDGLLTHRFDIADAADAYCLLEERQDEAIQVALTYG
ncbi:oxidoreductase [Haloarcula mannanilytica]|uniref:Oxidoreductase n=1 Tax=Haloarcula mannanilytica TaxID=2509225 RepID=A0A4C2EHI7_9EURY|nr:zinc-binding alcohol dehydrogenase [Haloarcula mannanilytica]GCF13187.1 oxidoreductase [Haloarcula mannanilytica]